MKSVVYQGPRVVRIEQLPRPTPKRDEALIRVISVGICGSDIHGYMGETGRREPGLVMGHEIVGEVVEIAHTGELSTGDLVAINPVLSCGNCDRCLAGLNNRCALRSVLGVNLDSPGGFSEYLTAPTRNLVKIHHLLPQHALLEPFAVGLEAVRNGRISSGQRVLVIGAGVVGVACAWVAEQEGAIVEIVDVAPEKVSLARDVGLDANLAVSTKLSLDADEPFDAVIDAVGIDQTIRDSIAKVGVGGTVVLVGMGKPSPSLPGFDLVTHQVTLVGTWCYSATNFEEALDILTVFGSDLTRLISEEISLDDLPDALRKLASGEAPSTAKILVHP